MKCVSNQHAGSPLPDKCLVSRPFQRVGFISAWTPFSTSFLESLSTVPEGSGENGEPLEPRKVAEVLNDLGLVAISEAGAVLAVAFGGATERFSCRLALQGALQLFPVSFRGWPGPVPLRRWGN